MFGILEDPQIEEVLKKQMVGRLGCNDEGVVYVVPISYAYDGKYIYVHTHEGMKINMMRKNPEICFQTDLMQDMANWKSVIVWGQFEELKEGTDRNYALQKLMERKLPIPSSETVHLSPIWPFSPENINTIEGIVFRIRLTKKTGRFESSSVSELSSF